MCPIKPVKHYFLTCASIAQWLALTAHVQVHSSQHFRQMQAKINIFYTVLVQKIGNGKIHRQVDSVDAGLNRVSQYVRESVLVTHSQLGECTSHTAADLHSEGMQLQTHRMRGRQLLTHRVIERQLLTHRVRGRLPTHSVRGRQLQIHRVRGRVVFEICAKVCV